MSNRLIKIFNIEDNVKVKVYEKTSVISRDELIDISLFFNKIYPNDKRFNQLESQLINGKI